MTDINKHIEKLINMLQSPKSSTRYEACEHLRVAPTITTEAIKALQNALNDPDASVAESAQRALAIQLAPDPSQLQFQDVQKRSVQSTPPINDIKQEITDALKMLNDQNVALRIEAVKRLGKIGISHPQITGQLQAVIENDPSTDVRLTAQHVIGILQNVPNDNPKNISSPLQPDESILKTEKAILEILQKQNEILENIQVLVVKSLEKENEKAYHFRSRITDIDMSIGSMVDLSFKWLIASIPVGIVIGILWSLILAIFVR